MNFAGIFLLLAAFSAIAGAADFSVGVSPNMIDLGDLNPGEQKLVKFSVFTVSDEPLLVYLEAGSGNMDFFNRGYAEIRDKFSEEPTASWVEFINNPTEIEITNKTAGRSWKDVSFLVNIPANAEPGYHVIKILPKPTVYGGPNAPVGTTIVSVTEITILFNVRGDAKRDGTILDTTVHSYSTNGFELRTFFRNTGTMTLFATAGNKIYDVNGTFIGEFLSANEYVKPQSTTTFITPVNSRTAPGQYRVSSTVTFSTGEAAGDATINLNEASTVPAQERQEFPPTIVILIIAAIIIIVAVRWLSEKRL